MTSIKRQIEEVESLNWSSSTHHVWNKVFHILQELTSESENDRHGMIEILNPILSRLLTPTFLLGLWSKVLSMNVENGSNEGSNILNGYRLMANVFQQNLPDFLQHQFYVTTVLRALVVAIRDVADVNPYTIDGVICSLTDSNTVIFLTETVVLEGGSSVVNLLCGITNPIWLINAAKIILKLLLRSPASGKSGLESALRDLVRSAVERGVSAAEIADALVLAPVSSRQASRKTYASIAIIILESIPSTSVVEVLNAALFVWGDKGFVSRADVTRMAYLTEVVIAALARCDRRQLSVMGSRHLPLELGLSMGISQYLEVDSLHLRVHGMRAAQAYARVIGEPLHFAELDALDAQEAKDEENLAAEAPSSSSAARQGGKSSGAPNSGSPAAHSKPTTTATHTANTDHSTSVGYDTDSSEELVGYDVDEEDPSAGVYNHKDKLLTTNYLRDCLQMLRCPDSKPEARQQLQAALARIPAIMASNPPDARDLCVPLVKELLTVANAFNIEEFDTKRTAAVQSILQPHAVQVVPFLTTALQGQELPLGLKLIVVDWLMAAARELSDIPEVQQLTSGEAESSTSVATADSSAGNGKVRIKRPTVLANSKKRTRYFRNEFGALAHLFIHPLMNILGRAWNNTLAEPLLPHKGEEFNLISEMFEPAAPKKDTASADAVKDVSLSHLEGVDALLPSQCLVALGLFARCCVNTVNQREHALQVIKTASAFRSASAVALRRAALYALRLSMEAYLPAPASKSASASAATRAQLNRGPLESLLHISEPDVDIDANNLGGGPDAAAVSIMSQPVIIDCVDWAASTWKEDADEVSRTLKHEIVNIAVKGLS